MSWRLVEKTATSQEVHNHNLQAHNGEYLVLSKDSRLSIISTGRDEDRTQALASIAIAKWGVKLEALNDDVGVVPAHPRSNANVQPSQEEYKLTKKSSEIIFIREHDKVYLSSTTASLTLAWNNSEVQVNSSIALDAEIPASEEQEIPKSDDGEDLSDSETDNEDLDNTITTVAGSQSHLQPQFSHATPAPSVPPTEIVQETPAANRVTTEFPLSDEVVETADAAEDLSPPDQPEAIGNEIFCTTPKDLETDTAADSKVIEAATDEGEKNDDVTDKGELLTLKPDVVKEELSTECQSNLSASPRGLPEVTDDRSSATSSEPLHGKLVHPQVRIPKSVAGKKRTSPMPSLDDALAPAPPAKRARKTTKDSQDSALSNTNVAEPVKASKRRTSRGLSLTPSNTSDSPVNSVDLYAGPKPIVAFSNSSIPDAKEILKFFKKQGGTQVDAVRDGECNLLCIRDGPIVKTMKLLRAIALGIPIVTDRWLNESAQQSHLLAIHPYVPSQPAQEREWNVSIASIVGIPQPSILQNRVLYFTPALKSSYTSFQEAVEVCKAAGALSTISKQGSKVKDSSNMVLLAAEGDDPDLLVLQESGHTCYTKDMLTNSILRGKMDLESDEFKIPIGGSQGKNKAKGTKGRGRPKKG